MMKKVLIILLVLLVAAFAVYKYVYQSHRDIQNEEAVYTVNATDLAKEFSIDQDVSSKKYLNKTIIVTGVITEIEDTSVMLNEAVYCTFDTNNKTLEPELGAVFKIKGRCIGYDELLEVIKLDQATILK